MSETEHDWFYWAAEGVAQAKEQRARFEMLFSIEARRAVRDAIALAEASGSDVIGAEHLFISLVPLLRSVRRASDLQSAALALKHEISAGRRTPTEVRKATFSPRLSTIIHEAPKEAASLGRTTVEPEHFLLALLGESEGAPARLLKGRGIDREALRRRLIAELAGGTDGDEKTPKV